MTCDEFKKCNSRGVRGILDLTRAERSAAGQHWTNCFECREWSATVFLSGTPEEQVEAEMLKYKDRLDPETFFLGSEEAEKFDLDKRGTDVDTITRGDQSSVEGGQHADDQ